MSRTPARDDGGWPSASAFRDKHRISYPIGHSADPDVIADALGRLVAEDVVGLVRCARSQS